MFRSLECLEDSLEDNSRTFGQCWTASANSAPEQNFLGHEAPAMTVVADAQSLGQAQALWVLWGLWGLWGVVDEASHFLNWHLSTSVNICSLMQLVIVIRLTAAS